MNDPATYYVYGYFDPRSYELFYVGKGKGSRKKSHLQDQSETPKVQRIREITEAGGQPTIRVIAANLTEEQAYLVEAALIWRCGESLANLVRGKFAENFRPPYSLHRALPGFDTTYSVKFVNVGECECRCWEDSRKYGFLAAGHGSKYSVQLKRLEVGDVAAAYLNQHGYVGIGRITSASVPVSSFRWNGRPLVQADLQQAGLLADSTDAERCEHLVAVNWIKVEPRQNARFLRKAKLFTTRQVVATLLHLPTLKFLEEAFGVSFEALLAPAEQDQ